MNGLFGTTAGEWIAEVSEKSACVTILGARSDGNIRKSDGLGTIVVVEYASEPNAIMFSPMIEEDVANARAIAQVPAMLELVRSVYTDSSDPVLAEMARVIVAELEKKS